MTPACFTFPEIRRGDSIAPFVIAELTYADTASPVLLTSAALEIRATDATLIKRYDSANSSITLTPEGAQNTVTLSFVSGAITADFPAGNHQYDLKVVLQSGETWTVLAGQVRIVSGITQ